MSDDFEEGDLRCWQGKRFALNLDRVESIDDIKALLRAIAFAFEIEEWRLNNFPEARKFFDEIPPE